MSGDDVHKHVNITSQIVLLEASIYSKNQVNRPGKTVMTQFPLPVPLPYHSLPQINLHLSQDAKVSGISKQTTASMI